MTERLYYDNAYLTAFEANVLECRTDGDRVLARLDRSAFYPTSGGQPYDTGTISGVPVKDVFVDDAGEVWHELEALLSLGPCAGQIDWPRRFDHMQQHTADHMIANALYRFYDAVTIGLHIGAEISTIDVAMPEGRTHLTDQEIIRIEDDVNEKIQSNVPIRCYFPDSQTLSGLPLRKPPTVKEHIRVVQIGELEYVACGGTHPRSAGEIGCVKIVDARPSRGKMRLGFLAGQRAFADYRSASQILNEVSNFLTTSRENVPQQISALTGEVKSLRQELRALKRGAVLSQKDALIASARALPDGWKLIVRAIEAEVEDVRELASSLGGMDKTIALLSTAGGDTASFVFAASPNCPVKMNTLLRESFQVYPGKGGGRADFAEGRGDRRCLMAAEEYLLKQI